MDIQIEVKERFNYIARSAIGGVLVLLFLYLVITAGDETHTFNKEWNAIIIIAITVFLLYYTSDPLGARYFLLSFELKDEHVSITYKDKMKILELKGNKKDFKARKDWGRWGRYASPAYFEIKYRGEVILKEYFYRGLSKANMDKIIDSLG
jgi:hypothetical protein